MPNRYRWRRREKIHMFTAEAVGSTANRLQDNITLGCISGPWLRPLGLRDTYEMRFHLGPEAFVIGAGGVTDLQSAVQQIMVGADAVWACTETMLRGFDWLPKLLEELKAYMQEMGCRRIRDFRDLLLGDIKTSQELRIRTGCAAVDLQKCTSCGLCWKIGPCQAISHPDNTTRINRGTCLACSTCVDLCPQKAITMVES